MSTAVLKGNASGTGIITLETPNTNTDMTIALPARAGNLMMDGPAFSAYKSAGQTISNATFTKVQSNTEEFDTNNNYDNGTNYRFTPTISGYYQINAQILGQATTNCTGVLVGIYKNGSAFKWGNFSYPGSSTAGRATVSALIYMNGSSDYLELYGYVVGTGTVSFAGIGASDDYFQGCLVRGA